MSATITRRRFVAITAAASGVMAAGVGRAAAPLHVWEGTALGARASLRLYHPDPAAAARLIEDCRREIVWLEHAFSLYRPDSAVNRLNAEGVLDAPPLDLVRLLDQSRRLGTLTGGAFDVTVQPIWLLYARHFATAPGADGPPASAVAEAAARVGQDAIEIAPARIAFARRGMAVTLNGIAQGYMTDRIAELLRRQGLDHVLVDLGEARAIGGHPDGRPWRAALGDPRTGKAAVLDLRDRALATTAPGGFAFDPAGRFHHIFDPRSGEPAARYESVSVLAPDATTADALSTAFVQMSEAEIAAVAARHGGVAVHLNRDGRTEELPRRS